jgi:hypothetical protein
MTTIEELEERVKVLENMLNNHMIAYHGFQLFNSTPTNFYTTNPPYTVINHVI